jgi:hypothetical protein
MQMLSQDSSATALQKLELDLPAAPEREIQFRALKKYELPSIHRAI